MAATLNRRRVAFSVPAPDRRDVGAQDRFNVIFAPHQRLAERDPEIRAILADAARLPHVHADIDSFAAVDGSYMAVADIYLGDTSSQVMEYLARPRPCIFLNNRAAEWRGEPEMGFWTCGEVIDSLGRLPGAGRHQW